MNEYYKKKLEILFIEFTTKCNSHCIFCKTPENQNAINLEDIKGYESLFDNVEMVDITGTGEITTHPKFKEILTYFKSKNLKVRMVTNGILLDKYYDDVLNSSIYEMVISINSLNKENYKKMCGTDNFERVYKNSLFMSKNFKGNLRFSFVINKLNFDEIHTFINFGKQTKTHIACLGLTPTLQEFYPKEIILENNEENKLKLQKYKDYAKSSRISHFIFDFDTQAGSEKRNVNLSESIKKCEWINKYMSIGVNGNVLPCCWNKKSMGNILESSFDEIWNGKEYQELRELCRKGDTKYCLNCRKDG
jgi:MoaA/NifB/PqqE/SkfB family radical SAM enzyme